MAKRAMSEAAWAAHQRLYGRADAAGVAIKVARRSSTDRGPDKPIEPVPARPNRREFVTLEIPFPPTTNHDKRPNGKGGQILTEETQAFRDAVTVEALKLRSPWVAGRVSVVITLFPPDRRAYDLDNRIKPTLDAIQAAGIIPNDRQVKRIVIAEADIREGGAAAVSVQAGA